MCEFSSKLMAWLDQELPAEESAAVGRHLQACVECRSRARAYEEISSAFAAYCDRALEQQPRRRPLRWAAILGGVAAAAIAVLLAMPRPVARLPLPPPPPAPAPAFAFAMTPAPVRVAHRRKTPPPLQAPEAAWLPAAPSIEIAIPADAMFPPGAVPPGLSFIAHVSLAADGSAQLVRLRP